MRYLNRVDWEDLGKAPAPNFLRKPNDDIVFQSFWNHLCVFFECIFMLRVGPMGARLYVSYVV